MEASATSLAIKNRFIIFKLNFVTYHEIVQNKFRSKSFMQKIDKNTCNRYFKSIQTEYLGSDGTNGKRIILYKKISQKCKIKNYFILGFIFENNFENYIDLKE